MRKMKRLKWVHDKKIRMEKPDQGGPRDSGFAQCRVVTRVAAVLKHQPSKLAISLARTGLKLESCHATAPTIWKNKTDLNRSLDPSTLYANHKVVSGVDTRAMQNKAKRQRRWGATFQKTVPVFPVSESVYTWRNLPSGRSSENKTASGPD